MRKLWDSFWQLSKSERIGISLLVLLLLAWLGSSVWLDEKPEVPIRLDEELEAFLEQQQVVQETPKDSVNVTVIDYFYFDINSIDSLDLLRLGVGPKSIAGLMRYRNKGGKVKSIEDFNKLFSLTEADKARLGPWLQFESQKNAIPNTESGNPMRSEESSSAVFARINVNLADSASLTKVPGIGPTFASRIVRYRDRLGGFLSSTQLLEVYGVDSARLEQWAPFIIVEEGIYRKLNLNEASEEVLSSHPYISKTLARRIVSYREQHGTFKSPDALGRIHGLNEKVFNQLRPYIAVEELQQAE
ncbi:MAG: helix-hairpin-helix domain-containing protein [Bacteroidia bacterium]